MNTIGAIIPANKEKKWWFTILLVTTTLLFLMVPLNVIFNRALHNLFISLELVGTIVFLVDLNKQKSLPSKEKALDIIGAIPFYTLVAVLPHPEAPGIASILAILHFARYKSLIPILGRMRNSRNHNPGFVRMTFLIFWIIIVAHFISCLWILVSGNPLMLNDIELYVRAFYWTVTTLTTIGYGDITPDGMGQTLFVIVTELIGAGMYGFIIGNIANIIANLDIAKTQHQEKLEKVSTFLRYKSIPSDLEDKILDYYNYIWENRRGYDESTILADLPRPLQSSVSLYLNKELIEKVPLFKGASAEFVKDVILHLEPVVFTPGDHVMIKGEIGYEMYFISKGTVDVVSEDEKQVYATLGSGAFFGEIALLLSAPRNATIKAKEFCECYSLNKTTFETILTRFPDFEKNIRDMAESRSRETKEKSQARKDKK